MKQITVPSNIEAEEALLGSVLVDPNCLYRVAGDVHPEDFYIQKNRLVYEAMAAVLSRNAPLDFMTVVSELDSNGKLEAVGGAAYISRLINAVPSALNFGAYADMVTQTATRRRLISAATEIARNAYNETLDVSDVLDMAETTVFQARGNSGVSSLVSTNEVARGIMTQLEKARETGNPLEFDTGYTDLDRLYRLRKGEVTLIGARTSIGKTAFLMNLAQRSAYAGRRVLFFSLEMTARALVQRIVVSEGKVKLSELSSGVFEDSQWGNIIDGLAKAADLPIWIDDTPGNNTAKMRAQALRMAAEKPIDLICVDYLQLVSFPQKVEKRYLEIGEVMKALKALAKDLDCSVVSATQLGRDAEGSRPTLRDLRESGNQEQDADNVIFIHRQREATGNVEAEIIVAKQRQGPVGTVRMVWIPERVSFVPAARRSS